MAESVKFVDGTNYTEAEQADFNMRLRPEGVLPEAALGVITVSLPGGLFIRVSPGEALIRGFLYKNTANLDKAVGANSSGSTRIDTVILKLDTAGNTCTAQVKAGTPGAGAPTLEQVTNGIWEFPLYDITVPNGATAPTLTTDRAIYSRWPVSTLDTALATDAEVTSAVAAEATLRSSADSTLTTNLNAEITNRGNAITSEASTRATADTNEANTRASAITTEASTRASADTALGVRINNEGTHARGTITAAGGAPNGTGISAISKPSTGTYTITLSQAYTTMIIQITPRNMGSPGSVRVPSAVQITNTQFTVYITGGTDGSGLLDSDFFFCVWEA